MELKCLKLKSELKCLKLKSELKFDGFAKTKSLGLTGSLITLGTLNLMTS